MITVLLGVELGLRIFFSLPQLQPLLFVNESVSWQRYWVARHKDKDTAEIYYTFDQYDPLLGWRNQPDVRDMPAYDGKFVNTNNRGFRGIEDTAYEKTPGIIRVAILGDSFTFGDEVSDDETYSYFLQRMMPDTEIINMGVHGYGHDQMLLFFEEEGRIYNSDLVILGFTKIDMERNVLSFRDFAKPVFEIRDGELQLENTPVPTPEQVLRTDWMRPRLVDAYQIFKGSLDLRSGDRARAEEAVTRLILDRLVERIVETGATPLFVYIPFGPEVLEAADRTTGEAYFFDFCDSNYQVTCFSTRPDFLEAAADGADLAVDFHWDAAGHQIIAESMYRYLSVETSLVPVQTQ